jgi:predicted dehydrogenase
MIVGLGRAGLGLHWAVLRRMRAAPEYAGLFAPESAVAWDLRRQPATAPDDDLITISSLEESVDLLDPERSVVHLCTPPRGRLDTLRRLARLGFRRILIEKPISSDWASAQEIDSLRATCGLHLIVVAPWLESVLTRLAMDLIRSERLGRLTEILIVQRKPRLQRTLEGDEHPTVLDVELPHSVGVALHLAGDARVDTASWTSMRVGKVVVPRMGGAQVVLQHEDVRTKLITDLMSPIRERRIRLAFTDGTMTGYYAASDADCYAFATVVRGRTTTEECFPDDTLTAFIAAAYRRFAAGADTNREFDLNMRVTALLDDAKARCESSETGSALHRVVSSGI